MESEDVWAFACVFGRTPDDCGEYAPDERARGWGRQGGCPSCLFREPANDATRSAEIAWNVREAVKPPEEERTA